MPNPNEGAVFKATKQSSKSYSSLLASAGAWFKAVTWKQEAPCHPHGLPAPLTLRLLKGDSTVVSLCLRSVVLKIHSALYVSKWILSKRNTFLLFKILWWLRFIAYLLGVTLLLSTFFLVHFFLVCCHGTVSKVLPSLCCRIILRSTLCSHHVVIW